MSDKNEPDVLKPHRDAATDTLYNPTSTLRVNPHHRQTYNMIHDIGRIPSNTNACWVFPDTSFLMTETGSCGVEPHRASTGDQKWVCLV